MLPEKKAIEPSDAWKQHLASLAGFDPATLASLAEAFLSEVPGLCRSLCQAIEVEDQKAAVRIAHSLRGSFRCVDPSGQAESRAKQVETAAEQERFQQASQLLPAVQQASEQWCQRVATLIDSPPAEEENGL